MEIGVVIVTYNRLEKLKIALQCFENQSFKPTYIVVINNCSTDGTEKYLQQWKNVNSGFEKNVITTDSNLGGSGGFYRGLEFSTHKEADWIWVSDDDAFPDSDALNIANDFLLHHQKDNISAICASVINMGEFDFAHRKKITGSGIKIMEVYSKLEDYKKEYFDINAFSYVGTIINKSKLEQVGLTEKDYFIWCDDTEHSLRLSRVGRIVCVPQIRVQHDVKAGSSDLNWKDYYGWRNSIDLYSKNFSSRFIVFLYTRHILRAFYYLIKKRNLAYFTMYITAITDAYNHNLGVNSIYKPGWKAK